MIFYFNIFEFGFDFAVIFYRKKFKNSDSAVCMMTPWSQNFRLSKSTFHTSNFLFHDRCFTPKRTSPEADCPFKSNQRQSKFWILNPQCALCSLTHRCDAHPRD